MKTKKTDILFVSNFSKNLDELESQLAKELPNDITHTILTYRKTTINNAFSYEDFIAANYERINEYDISKLNKEFEGSNLYLAVVCERFFTNYYYGIEKTLGNKRLSYEQINFLIKSFVLFLSPYIKESKLIFSGYADNFISTLTYLIAEKHEKKCIAFHEVSIIDNDSNFLFEGLYAKPYHDLIIHPEPKKYEELCSFIQQYDGKKDVVERAKKNKKMKKGIFGVFSPNIFDIRYLRFAFFGYKTDSRISVYMNIDKPDIYNKLKANISRVYNKLRVKVFFTKLDFNYDDNVKYIYFPFQVQPEASTASRTPFYMNQLATLENISKSLPLGYKLLVKEHPLAIGMNSVDFYKKVLEIPNVELVNFDIKGNQLIEISELIISFGGTTLFESILRGKKVLILLKDYMYADSKLIFKVFGKNDISAEIAGALDAVVTEDEKKEEKEKMLNFFYQRGFPRFDNFEKNITDNLVKIYNLEA